jgi:PKD repeat protein
MVGSRYGRVTSAALLGLAGLLASGGLSGCGVAGVAGPAVVPTPAAGAPSAGATGAGPCRALPTGSASSSPRVAPTATRPTAAFTVTLARATVAVDGRRSCGPADVPVAYAWDFGDGSTGTGAVLSHTYASGGTFRVTLTVTADGGAAGSVTEAVKVPQLPIVEDSFDRTSTGGWGTADTGGTWTPNGSQDLFSVSDGLGEMTMSGVGEGVTMALGSVSSTATDVRLRFSLDKTPTGGGQYVSIIGRGISFTSDYRTKVRLTRARTVEVTLSRVVSGVETELETAVLPGVAYARATWYSVRMQASGTGSTNLRAKVWWGDEPEPAAWTVTTTDRAASLQVAGWVGVGCYLSETATNGPVTLFVDHLLAEDRVGAFGR